MEKYIVNASILLFLLLVMTTFMQFSQAGNNGSCPDDSSKCSYRVLQTDGNYKYGVTESTFPGISAMDRTKQQSFYRPAGVTITLTLEKN